MPIKGCLGSARGLYPRLNGPGKVDFRRVELEAFTERSLQDAKLVPDAGVWPWDVASPIAPKGMSRRLPTLKRRAFPQGSGTALLLLFL
jgi:hypothetical protein